MAVRASADRAADRTFRHWAPRPQSGPWSSSHPGDRGLHPHRGSSPGRAHGVPPARRIAKWSVVSSHPRDHGLQQHRGSSPGGPTVFTIASPVQGAAFPCRRDLESASNWPFADRPLGSPTPGRSGADGGTSALSTWRFVPRRHPRPSARCVVSVSTVCRNILQVANDTSANWKMSDARWAWPSARAPGAVGLVSADDGCAVSSGGRRRTVRRSTARRATRS